jgi:ATP-binding cassette subfamily G (WHITE) protein 2 (PDR)
MSVVGNFSFSNYDRTSQAAGSSPLQHTTGLAYDADGNEVEEVFTPMEQREAEVAELARQITRQSISRQNTHQSANPLSRMRSNASSIGDNTSPVDYEEGGDLDPYSENFDIKKWTRRAVRHNRDTPQRSSGLAYSNLSVFGYGSESGA